MIFVHLAVQARSELLYNCASSLRKIHLRPDGNLASSVSPPWNATLGHWVLPIYGALDSSLESFIGECTHGAVRRLIAISSRLARRRNVPCGVRVSDVILRWAAPDFTAAGGKHAVCHGGALRLPSRPVWNLHTEVLREECKELRVNYYFTALARASRLPENLRTKRGNFSPKQLVFLPRNKCIEQPTFRQRPRPKEPSGAVKPVNKHHEKRLFGEPGLLYN